EREVIIPDHTVIFIPCDEPEEAHYICAVLNSSPAHALIKNYIVLHPDPHVMGRVRVPKFDRTNKIHFRLSSLSKSAHEVVSQGRLGNLSTVETDIDLEAAKVWNLTAQELKDIQETLSEI